MKKLTILISVLLVAFVVTIPVFAKGGNGKKTLDVCWMQGDTRVQAKFKTTGSGIVQQFRYEPNDLHLIFKPKSKFDKPDEPRWFSWNAYYYGECPGWDGAILEDIFSPGSSWWVTIKDQ